MTPELSAFPATRLRRTRQSDALRRLVAETSLSPDDFIWPIFLCDGVDTVQEIPSMPGVQRLSVDRAVLAAKEACALGIPAICLFPYTEPSKRSEGCEEAWNPNNLSNTATRAIKDAVPDMLVMSDVALDPYSDTGHDGFVENGVVVNDRSVEALVRQGVAQAEAGVDIIGPSDMMDGRVGALRDALESGGYQNTLILSYAVKYASAFYGPFRDAVGAAASLKGGDKKTYQMNPANTDEAMRLVARDLREGADMVMIKPGMPYLDMCRRVKDQFGVPTFAYQVSGEYAMLMAAAQNGWLDGDKVALESLIAFKRAGCDGILTYFAPRAAKLLGA